MVALLCCAEEDELSVFASHYLSLLSYSLSPHPLLWLLGVGVALLPAPSYLSTTWPTPKPSFSFLSLCSLLRLVFVGSCFCWCRLPLLSRREKMLWKLLQGLMEDEGRNLGKPKQKSSQGQIFILSIFCILLSAADFVGRKFKPKPK